MKEPSPLTPPGMRDVAVPLQYRDHALLKDAPYFTLPKLLIDYVVAEVGTKHFDAALLKMEYELSDLCGDHSSRVGFWRDQPIAFMLLHSGSGATADLLAQARKQWGTSTGVRETLTTVEQRPEWTAKVRRGYCGWLMTNRVFLDEHRQVFQVWADQVAENGIPKMGPVVRDAQAVPNVQIAEGKMEQFIRAFEDFFIRWRLEGMPAPFAPQPMGMFLPVVDLRPVLGHMKQGGTTFYIPDIFPIQSRDELREILEESVRTGEAPDHLASWLEIVHSDNVAKNRISRYARLFDLQHYLRSLYSRHAAALKRKKTAVILAMARYLGVSDDVVVGDLRRMNDRLGKDSFPPTF